MAPRFNHLLAIAALFIIVAANAVTPAESVATGFQVTYHLQPGQGFVVAGNITALGNWSVTAAPQMTWASGDIWSVVVDITGGTPIQFKLVEVVYNTKACICWDASGNKNWTVPTESRTYYFDSFTCDSGSCGSSQDIVIKEVIGT